MGSGKDSARVDPASMERQFWHMAILAATTAQDQRKAYKSLQAQYRSTRPDASPSENTQAMTRLAHLFKVGGH